MLNPISKERLEILATHLSEGKLDHEQFDFGRWNSSEEDEILKPNGCGYSGCAIGELPYLFPNEWQFCHRTHDPRLKSSLAKSPYSISPLVDAIEFFGITCSEAEYLFTPMAFTAGNAAPWNEYPLGFTASRHAVAMGIKRFIQYKESGILAPHAAQTLSELTPDYFTKVSSEEVYREEESEIAQ